MFSNFQVTPGNFEVPPTELIACQAKEVLSSSYLFRNNTRPFGSYEYIIQISFRHVYTTYMYI